MKLDRLQQSAWSRILRDVSQLTRASLSTAARSRGEPSARSWLSLRRRCGPTTWSGDLLVEGLRKGTVVGCIFSLGQVVADAPLFLERFLDFYVTRA